MAERKKTNRAVFLFKQVFPERMCIDNGGKPKNLKCRQIFAHILKICISVILREAKKIKKNNCIFS